MKTWAFTLLVDYSLQEYILPKLILQQAVSNTVNSTSTLSYSWPGYYLLLFAPWHATGTI